jgi:hypothetical protein
MSTPDKGVSKIPYRMKMRGLKEKPWYSGKILPYNIVIGCLKIAIGYSRVSGWLLFCLEHLANFDEQLLELRCFSE